MRLRLDIPADIDQTLQRHGIASDQIVLSLSSDIDLLGQYDPQWVVVTATKVWVIQESQPEMLPGLCGNIGPQLQALNK